MRYCTKQLGSKMFQVILEADRNRGYLGARKLSELKSPPHENLIWFMIWFGKNQIATNWHDPPFCCKIIHGFVKHVKPNSSFTGLTGLSQCLKMDETGHA